MKALLLALALLAVALSTAGASGARERTSAGRVSSGALLAAGVPWTTVQQVAGLELWPELPAFNTIVDQEDPQPLTAVSQAYRDIGGSQTLLTELFAFASPGVSLQFLQSNAIVVERIDQSDPAIGDQHFYYLTTTPDGRPATRFYFIRGKIGASVQVDGAGWSRSRIARLAAPIDERIQQLLAGKLPVPPVPPDQLERLPAPGAAAGLTLGTASVDAEAWATIVHKGSPAAIRGTLARTGNATFPFRRYLRRGSATDVVETSAFRFPSEAAALAWFAPFAAGVRKHPGDELDAGATGSRSAFRFELENHELQFVAGRYVADVFCWAPFVSTVSPACEGATRALAERWYTQLDRAA